MSPTARIAIVEDVAVVRGRIATALNAQSGWQVVAMCADSRTALRDIPGARPTLILLDIVLPDGSGVDLIPRLRAAVGAVPILMLTVVETPSEIVRAIRAGACGYLLKRDATDLRAGVAEVIEGGAPVMSPSVARHLWNLAGGSPPLATRESSGLTPREWEVLRLITRGRQQDEIARELGIAVNTVKIHRRHIYEKLGVHSSLEALIRFNGGRGLLDGPVG